MRGAVLAHGDARVRGADLDVEVRVADGVADLLERTAGGEHGKGACERDATGGGNARRETHHVALSNAGVKEAVGVGGLELARLGGGG